LFLSTLLSWLLQPLILIIWCLLIFLQSFEQTEFNYRSKSQSKTKKEVNEKRDERLLNANECRVDEEIADQEEMLTPRTRWERFLLAFLQIFLYKNEFSSVVKAC
jgi:ATP-dependent Zn protease